MKLLPRKEKALTLFIYRSMNVGDKIKLSKR